MVYNGYYKVMSNIPKMGHLTTPEIVRLAFGFGAHRWFVSLVYSRKPGTWNGQGCLCALYGLCQRQNSSQQSIRGYNLAHWIGLNRENQNRAIPCKGSFQHVFVLKKTHVEMTEIWSMIYIDRWLMQWYQIHCKTWKFASRFSEIDIFDRFHVLWLFWHIAEHHDHLEEGPEIRANPPIYPICCTMLHFQEVEGPLITWQVPKLPRVVLRADTLW